MHSAHHSKKKTVKTTRIFSIFQVKAIRNFDLAGFLGFWYVVQYYASSEEAPVYGCMRSMFSMEEDNHVSMFYIYVLYMYMHIIYDTLVCGEQGCYKHLELLNAVIKVTNFGTY